MATIRAGGRINTAMVGLSSLPRFRRTRLTDDPTSLLPTLTPPQYGVEKVLIVKLTSGVEQKLFLLQKTIRECIRRGGEDAVDILQDIMDHRLLGGGPGRGAHRLVDEFMACIAKNVAKTTARTGAKKNKKDKETTIYSNNVVDPGNKQRRRELNRGNTY